MKTETSLRRGILLTLAVFGLNSGCTRPESREPTRDAASNYAVRIDHPCDDVDRGMAAGTTGEKPSRNMAFEITGFAPSGSSKNSAEQKSAVTQAAVIDALMQAVIESRRNGGQTTSDFTVKISQRLTITHRQIGNGYEVEATLIARGVETTFAVKDGVLQHPPHELKLLRQLFDESRGEFALLGTNWGVGGCQARVACYEPAGLGPTLAGDASKSQ